MRRRARVSFAVLALPLSLSFGFAQVQVAEMTGTVHAVSEESTPALQDVAVLEAVLEGAPGLQKLRSPEEAKRGYAASEEGRINVAVTLTHAAETSRSVNWRSATETHDNRRQVQGHLSNFLQKGIRAKEYRVVGVGMNLEVCFLEVTPTGLAELLAHPEVEEVVPEFFVEKHLAQGIPLMGASAVRSTYDGTGVSIAIIDDGLDYNHPRLGGGSFPNAKVIGGRDIAGNDTNPLYTPNSHGTACAGIAAGDLGTSGDYIGGVAPGARLYALKVFPDNNNGASNTHIYQALDWCLTHQNDDPDNPIMVASLSLGGSRHYNAAQGDAYWTAFATLITSLNNAGITVLASAGNEGYCDSLGWPASVSNVISVGAGYDANFGTYYPCTSSASCHTDKIHSPSSGCPGRYYIPDATAARKVTGYSNIANFLDIVAPANQAYTTDNVGSGGYVAGDYYSSFGGTSAACPYAAGAVAVLQNAHKARYETFATPTEIRTYLTANGVNVTDTKGTAISITKPFVDVQASFNAIYNTPELIVEDAGTSTEIFNSGTFDLGVAFQGDPFTRTIRVRNAPPAGVTADLLTGSFTLTGAVQTADTLEASIAAGNHDTIVLSIPSSTSGEFTGTVSFTTNDKRKQNFSFTVTGEVVEDPAYEVHLSPTTVGENVPTNTVVGTLTATDPDYTTGFVYTLTGNASGRFKVVGDQVQVANGALLDHEANSSHQITVQAENPASHIFQDSFVINVLDVNEPPTISGVPAAATINELAAYNFTASAIDPDDGDDLTFSLVNGPSGASINADTGAFSWTPTEAQGDGSTYSFSVQVEDGDGLPSTAPIALTVQEVNSAPAISNVPASATINELSLYTFTALATDSDLPAQSVTFTLTGAPSGATITPGGSFSWTPTEAQGNGGVYTFNVVATDNGPGLLTNTKQVQLTVAEVNTAPVLANVPISATIDELAVYTFTATASDVDLPAQTLTFSLSGAPAGASIGASSGVFTWTPTEAQGNGNTYTFNVVATDNGPGLLTNTKQVQLTVSEVNTPPVLANVPASATIGELTVYTFTATASDVDLPAQTLTFSLSGAPAGASIGASSGVFTWTPTEAQGNGNTYTFNVVATDNGPGLLTNTKQVQLTVSEVNTPPVLANVPVSATIDELTVYTFTATASDVDLPAQTLTFSLSGAPAGASIGASSGVFTWTPTEAQGNGNTYTFNVVATDNGPGLLTNTKQVQLTVAEANTAPVLANVPTSATIDELIVYTFTATASDVDLPAQSLTFSLSGAPSGTTIGASSGVFTWTPTEAQGNGDTYTFDVVVTDAASSADTKSIALTVSEVNSAPVLAVIGPQEILAESELTFTASASDPDLPAQALQYSLDEASELRGMTINSDTGEFSWTPDLQQFLEGPTYSPTITVSDGTLQDSETFSLKILEINWPPFNVHLFDDEVNEGLFGVAFGELFNGDPNGSDEHVYTLTQNPGSLFAIEEDFLVTNAYLEPGNYPIEIEVREVGGDEFFARDEFIIKVLAVADADGDGLLNTVEAGAPSGDGNGDSIPDKYQANVVSLPDAGGEDYLTLSASAGREFSAVQTAPAVDVPANTVMPLGTIGFVLSQLTANETVAVRLQWTATNPDEPIVAYYQLDEDEWSLFVDNGVDGARAFDNGTRELELRIKEGGRGDQGGSFTTITHQGAPAFVTTQDVWGVR